MWFNVHPADLSFIESSPHKITNEIEIPAPPSRVFEILSTAEGQREWFRDFVDCRWTSAPPHAVGSTREIHLKLLSVKERFLAWEPDKRLTFCIYACTLPLVTHMLEDMRLEPAGEGTRFIWTVHYTPALVMRLVHPIARRIFGGMFRDSTEGLRRYIEGK